MRRDGFVRILRQSCSLWMLLWSRDFLSALSRAQTTKLDSTAMELNFFKLRFFLHLTVSLVSEIAMQLAKKSSSADLMLFLRG